MIFSETTFWNLSTIWHPQPTTRNKKIIRTSLIKKIKKSTVRKIGHQIILLVKAKVSRELRIQEIQKTQGSDVNIGLKRLILNSKRKILLMTRIISWMMAKIIIKMVKKRKRNLMMITMIMKEEIKRIRNQKRKMFLSILWN